MIKFQKINSLLLVPVGIVYILWVFVVVVYVITRSFGVGWQFVEELTGYWLVLLTYIPLSYALVTQVHIKTDIVTKRLPEKTRSLLLCCTDGLSVVIVSYLLYRSIEWLIYGIKADVHSVTNLVVLLWPIYLFIPIGLALFILALTITFANSVSGLRAKKQ